MAKKTATATVAATKSAKAAAAKPAKAAKAPAVKKEPTKRDLARKIFTKHYGTKTRKEVEGLFVTDAGLTEKGAQTYYQTFKKEADEVGSRAA